MASGSWDHKLWDNLPSKLKTFLGSKLGSVTSVNCQGHCQLGTKKTLLDGANDAESKLRKITFGERNRNKPNKSILLVGETGSGKSTMINAMVNYVAGVEFGNEVRIKIVDDGKGENQAQSQTSAVTVYEIFSENSDFNLTVIDTPGYGDTGGIEKDAGVAGLLSGLFKSVDGICEINVVGFVVNATVNRISDRQMYIFDSVLSLFGKDIEKNLVALFTHSDGGPATNAINALKDAKIPIAKDKNGEIRHFLFNNQVNVEPAQGDERARTRQRKALESAWGTSMEGMDDLFEFLKDVEPQDLKTTIEVMDTGIQIEAVVNDYEQQIKFIDLKQVERSQHEKALQEQKGANVTFDEPYIEKVRTDKMVTSCPVCKQNCHESCTFTYLLSPWWCKVIKNGQCTVCKGKCHHSKHVTGKERYMNKTRQVTKTFDDLLTEYKVCAKGPSGVDFSEVEKREKLISAIQFAIDLAEKMKKRLVEQSYQNVLNLQNIAMRGTSLRIFFQLDFLIEKLKETGNSDEKVEKLREIKRCVEQENSGGLRYTQGGFKNLKLN